MYIHVDTNACNCFCSECGTLLKRFVLTWTASLCIRVFEFVFFIEVVQFSLTVPFPSPRMRSASPGDSWKDWVESWRESSISSLSQPQLVNAPSAPSARLSPYWRSRHFMPYIRTPTKRFALKTVVDNLECVKFYITSFIYACSLENVPESMIAKMDYELSYLIYSLIVVAIP